MEWDPKEADRGDVVDRRGAGGGSGAGTGGMGDLGGVLGDILGGGGGLGGALGGGGASRGGSKAKKGGGIFGVLLMVAAMFVLPKILGSKGADVITSGMNLPQFPSAESADALPDEGRGSDAALPRSEDPDPELTDFANVIITDTNNVWAEQFQTSGKRYDRTKLVLYTGRTSTGCGEGLSQMGPFYCPADNQVYVDLGFFEELATRFGAAGDFAQAYVIAHEVGHHVQNVLGISEQVQRIEQQDPDQATGPESLSVRLELQADCLAGVWAHSRYERGQSDPAKRLDDGDIDEALDAASGVGDDAIQKSTTGSVNPEGFTHGTSAQRKRWFTAGYDSGSSDDCDTFNAPRL
ncbi:MAG: neutral zinc metallopeptidase [Microthrixaceae bacterium]